MIKKDEMEVLELINKKNRMLEDYGIESEEVLLKDYNDKINSLEPIERRLISAKKIGIKKYIFMTIFVILINIALFFLLKDSLFKFAGLVGFPIVLIMYLIEKNRLRTEVLIEQNKENLNKKVEENKKLQVFKKNKKVLEEVNIINAKIEVINSENEYQNGAFKFKVTDIILLLPIIMFVFAGNGSRRHALFKAC